MKQSPNYEGAKYITWCIVLGVSLSIMMFVPKESPLSIGFSVLLVAAIFFVSFRAVRQLLSSPQPDTKKADEAWRQSTFGLVWAWIEEAVALIVLIFMGALIVYLAAQRIRQDYREFQQAQVDIQHRSNHKK